MIARFNIPTPMHFSFIASRISFVASPADALVYDGAMDFTDRTHGLDLYDSEARWYDSLLGRTSTMDPLAEKYYSLSPQLWCAGNPVKYVDPVGKEIRIYFSKEEYVIYKQGNLYNNDNSEYTGANQFVWSVFSDLLSFLTDKLLSERLSNLEQSEQTQKIYHTDEDNRFYVNDFELEKQHNPVGGTVLYNPAQYYINSLGDVTPSEGLSHELLGHAWDSAYGKTDFRRTLNYGIPMYEIKAIYIENIVRKLNKRPMRTTFNGNEINYKLLLNPFKF